jgi:hypothetical protein
MEAAASPLCGGRDDLKRGQIGELTFLFEFGALERELEALRITQRPRAPL